MTRVFPRAVGLPAVLALFSLAACSGAGEQATAGTPQDALAAYHAALANRADLSRAPFLTPGSQVLIAAWDPSPGQKQAEAGRLDGCRPLDPLFAPDGSRAVILFDGSQPECSPYLFVAAGDTWHLDLESMAAAIVFDRNNHWRADAAVVPEYAFAFGPVAAG